MTTKGNTYLEVIQGDTLMLTIRLENIDLSTIDKIYFSCSDLNLIEEFEKNEDDSYKLVVGSNVTKSFIPSTYNYDITINFSDNRVKTIEYCGEINILKKTNTVNV